MALSCIRVKRRKCKLSLQNIKLYIFMFDYRVLLTVVSLVVGGVWLDRSNIITWVFLNAGYVHRSCLAMDLLLQKKRVTYPKWLNPILVSKGKIPPTAGKTHVR